MKKLIDQLEKIKKEKRLGFMTHVVVGYPSLSDTVSLVKVMVSEGVDIVELQIPFSDPLADGPTIMKACEKALINGTKVKDAFLIAEKLTKEVSVPFLFMAYFNTVFQYGTEKFCKDAAKVGITGLIVPDMPLEEEGEEHFIAACKKYGVATIRVVSPASTDERLKKNAEVASGFVYVTARQGITGVKDALSKDIVEYLEKTKKYFSIPIAVGFGIAKKEHLKALKHHADIAIVGSALIDVINSSEKKNMIANVRSFIKSLKMVD